MWFRNATGVNPLTFKALNIIMKPMETKRVFTPRPDGVLSSPSCAAAAVYAAAARTRLATTPTWCNRLNS